MFQGGYKWGAVALAASFVLALLASNYGWLLGQNPAAQAVERADVRSGSASSRGFYGGRSGGGFWGGK